MRLVALLFTDDDGKENAFKIEIPNLSTTQQVLRGHKFYISLEDLSGCSALNATSCKAVLLNSNGIEKVAGVASRLHNVVSLPDFHVEKDPVKLLEYVSTLPHVVANRIYKHLYALGHRI
jgi:hypothetical protein